MKSLLIIPFVLACYESAFAAMPVENLPTVKPVALILGQDDESLYVLTESGETLALSIRQEAILENVSYRSAADNLREGWGNGTTRRDAGRIPGTNCYELKTLIVCEEKPRNLLEGCAWAGSKNKHMVCAFPNPWSLDPPSQF